MLMVCISFDPAHLTSYSFNSNQKTIDLSYNGIQKEIDMPSQKILMYTYDYVNRILITIVTFENNLIDN